MFHLLTNVEEMKNISVLIEGAATKRFRPKKPFVTYGTRLAAKEATVSGTLRTLQVLSVTTRTVSKARQIKL